MIQMLVKLSFNFRFLFKERAKNKFYLNRNFLASFDGKSMALRKRCYSTFAFERRIPMVKLRTIVVSSCRRRGRCLNNLASLLKRGHLDCWADKQINAINRSADEPFAGPCPLAWIHLWQVKDARWSCRKLQREKEREKERSVRETSVKKFTRDLPRCLERIFPGWQKRAVECYLHTSAYINFLRALGPFPS